MLLLSLLAASNHRQLHSSQLMMMVCPSGHRICLSLLGKVTAVSSSCLFSFLVFLTSSDFESQLVVSYSMVCGVSFDFEI